MFVMDTGISLIVVWYSEDADAGFVPSPPPPPPLSPFLPDRPSADPSDRAAGRGRVAAERATAEMLSLADAEGGSDDGATSPAAHVFEEDDPLLTLARPLLALLLPFFTFLLGTLLSGPSSPSLIALPPAAVAVLAFFPSRLDPFFRLDEETRAIAAEDAPE
jgi:hypothetical protein